MNWLLVVLVILLVLLVVWVLAAVLVRRNRPSARLAPAAVQLLPDILELSRRLSADRGTGRRTRLELAVLAAWIRSPIDLIPDFLPAVGQLDDLIIALVVLRRVLRGVEPDRRSGLWPGTPEGFVLLERLLWGKAAAA
jgi:uncharacterized membrane protein YkvA (DUF1232 family)